MVGWQRVTRDGHEGLERDWTLDGFTGVRAAVTGLMDLAEQLDHHPEVRFGYRTLSVRWTTHDQGGITPRDTAAAEATAALLARLME